MPTLNAIDASKPTDAEDIRLGASRIRDLAGAAKTTFGDEHDQNSGDHKFLLDNQKNLDGIAAGELTSGRLWLNGTKFAPEFYLASDLTYADATVTVLFTAGSAIVTVTAGTPNWLTNKYILPGAQIKAVTHATYYTVKSVDSNTQLTLTAVWNSGGSNETVTGWTVRFLAAGKVPAGTTNFTVEHYENGQHKIPIRTDGTDPADVQDKNVWIDTSGGKNSLKFRDTTTKSLTQGQTFVWLATPVVKVAATSLTGDGTVWTNIDISADTGADTAAFAVFQVDFNNSGALTTNDVQSGVVGFRKNGTSLSITQVPAAGFLMAQGSQTGISTGTRLGSMQVIAEVASTEICQYAQQRNVNIGTTQLQFKITLIGYVK